MPGCGLRPEVFKDCEGQDTFNHVHEANDDQGHHRNLDLHCPPTLLAKKRTGMILTMLSKLFQPMCMLTSLLLLKVLLLLLKIISRTQGSLNSIRPIVCLELLNFKCDVNN